MLEYLLYECWEQDAQILGYDVKLKYKHLKVRRRYESRLLRNKIWNYKCSI